MGMTSNVLLQMDVLTVQGNHSCKKIALRETNHSELLRGDLCKVLSFS